MEHLTTALLQVFAICAGAMTLGHIGSAIIRRRVK